MHNASLSFGSGRFGITIFAGKSCDDERMHHLLPYFIEHKRQKESASAWIGMSSIVGEKGLIRGLAFAK
jgi:hypothetical protein